MKKTLLTLSIVLAQAFAVSALAQSRGEADPSGSKAAPSAPATAAEKAAAKAQRKGEGKETVLMAKRADADNTSMGTAKAATKEEKVAAAQKRKAAAAAAVKKGEITSGEK